MVPTILNFRFSAPRPTIVWTVPLFLQVHSASECTVLTHRNLYSLAFISNSTLLQSDALRMMWLFMLLAIFSRFSGNFQKLFYKFHEMPLRLHHIFPKIFPQFLKIFLKIAHFSWYVYKIYSKNRVGLCRCTRPLVPMWNVYELLWVFKKFA